MQMVVIGFSFAWLGGWIRLIGRHVQGENQGEKARKTILFSKPAEGGVRRICFRATGMGVSDRSGVVAVCDFGGCGRGVAVGRCGVSDELFSSDPSRWEDLLGRE